MSVTFTEHERQAVDDAVKREYQELERLVLAGHKFTRREVVERCIAEIRGLIAAVDPNVLHTSPLASSLLREIAVQAEIMADSSMDFIRSIQNRQVAERRN